MTTLKDALLVAPSKRQTNMISIYIYNKPDKFGDLMKLFLEEDLLIKQRASTIIGRNGQQHPVILKDHLQSLLSYLQNDPDAFVKRNIMRALQSADFPEELQGTAFEVCFGYLNDPDEPIGVRVFAMTALANICKKQPELENELKMSIETNLPFATAA